jgi:hypothetical protein
MGSSAAVPGNSQASTNNGTGNPNQPQFVEEPANYVFNYTLTALQSVQRVPVNIDRDSDFMLTGINGSSTGGYNLNFRLPSGRQIGSALVANTNFIGSANQPTSIGPPPVYRAGSTGPEIDLTDTSNAGNTIQVVFSGIRRLRTA